MDINKIGEHGLIKRIQARFSTNDPSIVLGIGDDAAIINPSADKSLLFSTDTLREGVHFSKKYCAFDDIGWKAVAVSISDIAAMGGVPKYLLLSLAVSYRTSIKDLDRLIDGVGDITARYGISLLGGNMSRSKGGVTIDTTVIGELNRGEGLVRSGAGEGDLIYVTGILGNASIGLSLLKAYSETSSTRIRRNASFVSDHLRPIPRVREGLVLGANRLATAAIDISDGLLADLGHICEQSGVGACIYSNRIPLPQVPMRIKKRLAKETLFYALYGGEDYELLFTVKRKTKAMLEAICRREKFAVNFIGEIVRGRNGIRIVDGDGVQTTICPEGYDHFKIRRVKND